MVALASRVFTMEDQHAFAELSGDYNPMHMDAIAARRLQAGAPVVHGVHLLLWALETLTSRCDVLARLGALRADFNSFLIVGREASLVAETRGEQTRITLLADAINIMTVDVRQETRRSPAEGADYPAGPSYAPSKTPLNLPFAEMQGMGGETPFFRPPADHATMFPKLAHWIGAIRIAALTCTTRIVGMICPGLHSIYNRIEAAFTEAEDSAVLRFAVTQTEQRFSRIRIVTRGGGLATVLMTTVRRPPFRQPMMVDIVRRVAERAFEGVTVLVVGGSRGLGELTAKYLAAGGGKVTITYSTGRADAERVAAEIEAFGRPCGLMAFDVHQPAREQLGEQVSSFTHVYYFPTPKITQARAKRFDNTRFEEFFGYYVRSFVDLCECLNNSRDEGEVRVLYPSSLWVQKDERPPGWTEYAMAKAAAEVICDDLDKSMKRVSVTAVRLPRLPTDQTASIFREDQEGPGLEVMGQVITSFHSCRA